MGQPLGPEDRDGVTHALNERRNLDPRVVFDQRFDWRGWWVVVRFGHVAGRLECIAMDVLGDPDADAQAPLTSLALRQLPLGGFIEEARQGYREALEMAAQLDSSAGAWNPDLSQQERDELVAMSRSDTEERLRLAGEAATDRPRGRPRAYGEDHFVEVAHVYKEAWGNGSRPTAAVAAHFGVSHSAAAKWVSRARGLNLLPPTSKGRAYG